ncbi:hypothetical protein QP968_00605 [Corynebacterium sp. MSK041]|uniref:hypothetical protein n=1 Tax=Corynebacterium sp. MSK041 TaxID=3050194 RepID=UPI00254A20FB|nr:hypothetical protein [Corynebacterium sp. MSK041]MDK8794213.1 hypothetical protein [Corynebacterium sp. MSK041]
MASFLLSLGDGVLDVCFCAVVVAGVGDVLCQGGQPWFFWPVGDADERVALGVAHAVHWVSAVVEGVEVVVGADFSTLVTGDAVWGEQQVLVRSQDRLLHRLRR